jgi:aryl-alcohol dehydrogenase-like predicted oxidoreductase
MGLQDSIINQRLATPDIRLGFGCGLLSLRQDATPSIRLIQMAVDTGITWFDTARLYCEGRAEGVLGAALAGKRDKVTIISKMGILPPDRSLSKRIARRMALTMRMAPPLKTLVAEPVMPNIRFGVFDIKSLRASVETSLRELRTDYLDGLLLHECSPADMRSGDILAFAEELARAGKIRSFGIAPSVADAPAILKGGYFPGAIVQFPGSVWTDNEALAPASPDTFKVVHSVLGQRFRDLLARLEKDDAAAARWQAELDMDPRDPKAMTQLFLGRALSLNPDGVVLFSTVRPDRVRDDLLAAKQPALSSDKIARMTALARSL